MYKKKTAAILIIILSISLNLFSQAIPMKADVKQINIRNFGTEVNVNYTNIEGSPYLNDLFLDAHVSLVDSVMDVRYNINIDEMEFKKGHKVYYMNKTDSLKVKFIKSNDCYMYLEFKLKDLYQKGYLILKTNNNKVNFYKRNSVTLVPYKAPSNSYSEPKPEHFRRDNDIYFIGLADGNIVEMPTKKKELLKMFPNKEKEIEAFLKSNKTSFKEENDLIVLVNYLDTLN